jgi:hypothetical protein
MGLTPLELRSRRAFDDETVMSMLPSEVLDVDGYVSREALARGDLGTSEDGASGRILLYLVRYRFPVLVGAGETIDGATALFNAGVFDYPFTAPIASVTSAPLPWSPHVEPKSGLVCQGFGWQRSRGSMLLAHAIVHVARLLNCDEEDREPSYVGYNAAAIKYWRTTMGSRPLTPGLRYPVPRTETTHGVGARAAESGFRLVDAETDTRSPSIFQLLDDEQSGIRVIGAA